MKKICLLIAVVFITGSCLSDFERKGVDPASESGIPNDFNWETMADVNIAVGAPTLAGVSEAANIRIYSSPLLYDENIVAKGVASANGRFRTSVAVPAGVADLYVKTTLPDGTTSVQSAAVVKTVTVPGAIMNAAAVSPMSAKALSTRAKQPSGFDELDIPIVDQKAPDSFEQQAVISKIESGKSYKLGGKTPYYVAENYLIPAGAVITTGIDLDGDYNGLRRTLYVAGKLILSRASIANVTLAVLEGGVVEITSVTANNKNDLAICVFKGGSFKAKTVNMSGNKAIVNKGTFTVTEDLNVNTNGMVYNFTGATMTLAAAEVTNSAALHNDGMLKIEDAEGNSNAKYYNWDNGTFDIDEFYSANGSVEVWQRGIAHFGDFKMSGGKFYFQCFTMIDEFDGDNGYIEIASGAGLEVRETDFNSGVKMSLASGSIFTVSELLKTGGADFTSEARKNSDEIPAVILITGEAYCAERGTSFKGGPLEVVYNGRKTIDEKLFSKGSGAYLSKKQTVVLPSMVCNGGKAPIDPDPDPLPENDYSMQEGISCTYCFEDSWPWLGDYDMNDAVVGIRVDREQSKDGSLVKSIVINWSLMAAGAQKHIGAAVQLDKVAASEVGDVVSTYRLGSGFFANGLEKGSELAVVPFFNLTTELLSSWNTFKDAVSSPITAHTTTITFKQPISVDKVAEATMNVFITVDERSHEVHMPGYLPTAFGKISRGNYQPDSPYKFYVADRESAKNNNMMWVLKIPGPFGYPVELNDIRGVYRYFTAWAQSNGNEHKDWYSADGAFDESKVY